MTFEPVVERLSSNVLCQRLISGKGLGQVRPKPRSRACRLAAPGGRVGGYLRGRLTTTFVRCWRPVQCGHLEPGEESHLLREGGHLSLAISGAGAAHM